jgi:hypothetical protein
MFINDHPPFNPASDTMFSFAYSGYSHHLKQQQKAESQRPPTGSDDYLLQSFTMDQRKQILKEVYP